MLIDWFTVAAQVVNFLILVWLLKRFLYRPILNAIDEREKRIAAQVAQATDERSKAQAERSAYEARNRELDAQREQILAAARKAANEERSALLQKVQSDSSQLRERLAAELVEQREEMTRAIGARLENDLFETTRRLLADLSDRNLEDAILGVFVRRLQSLSDEERQSLHKSLADGGDDSAITLRTAFELSSAQRATVEAALKQIAPAAASLRYERAPDLICGIELVADGHRLSWSMETYLRALRERVAVALRSAVES
jgi:F-type H+-transporting ATPase subunit b